ncbi:MAG TPA: RlmI/RlmK family 23S rRNA methyltransferase, partial [Sulfurovum sp.]|nr:RlmI/RlmK family 23S rRNA methyltransferase [Sulfurovum sp.]
MSKMLNLTLKPAFVKTYKSGYPLISSEAVAEWGKVKEEGTVLNLLDSRGTFIARGYYGKQNKGFGWVLTA